jgi:thiamine-phosphate pyrophosphorylase
MNDTPHCQLYLISPPQIADVPKFAHQLSAVLDATRDHIGAFQLRLKQEGNVTPERLTSLSAQRDMVLRTSDVLRPLCARYDLAFIMNDSIELASACHADGVHLGQEDGSIAHARAVLGEDAIVGVSCHASRHLAMDAGEGGADYVAFGAFYPTTSKSPESLAHWGTPEPEILTWWSTETVLPCVAIGGITPANARPLVAAGADFLAVISAVWHHPEGSVAAVRAFVDMLGETSENA